MGRGPGSGRRSLVGDVRRAVAVGVFLDYFLSIPFFLVNFWLYGLIYSNKF